MIGLLRNNYQLMRKLRLSETSDLLEQEYVRLGRVNFVVLPSQTLYKHSQRH